jgi:hypothetical protein
MAGDQPLRSGRPSMWQGEREHLHHRSQSQGRRWRR